MLRGLFYPAGVTLSGSFGLLVLRVVMGAAFIFHGWPKIQNPTGWMPAEAGFPEPLIAAAAIAEFAGGIALIIGLFTRLASLGLGITMAVAAGIVHIPAGHDFVPARPGQPSYELAVVYLACSVLFLMVGPGLFSADALMFRPRSHDL